MAILSKYFRLSFLTAFIITAPLLIAQVEFKIIGRITSANGLLTDGIKYTLKDSNGFMWFSYSTGFQRWDGYEVKNYYNYLNDTTLNSSYRYCRPILEDKHGNFFIGTLKNGLIKLNRKTDLYKRYVNDPDDPHSIGGNGVHEMFPDESGDIWIGTFVEGLSRFDPGSETFKNYLIIDDGLYHVCNNVKSLCKDSSGILWVGTANGLYQFDESKELFEQVRTSPELPEDLNSFECIIEDKFNNIWFGTNWGIFTLNMDTNKWKHISTNNPDKPESNADARIKCMVEFCSSTKHQIWIGTEAGLKVFDLKQNKLVHLTPKNGFHEITNAGVSQYLYIDENNILWASLGGITLIDLNDNPFDIYQIKSFPDSLYDTPAISFYEDKTGDFWIGTKANGLYHFDGNFNFISNYKPCPYNPVFQKANCNNTVYNIYEDPSGRIWMNAGPTNLAIFDMVLKKFHAVEVDVGSYVPGKILVDSFGVVWLAAHDGLHKGKMTGDYDIQVKLYNSPSLPQVPIDDLLYDTQDRLWVITRASGIFCLTPQNRDRMSFIRYLHQNYRHEFTIAYNARSMIEDDAGNIWFRSEKELYKYDPEKDSIVPDEYFNANCRENIYSLTCDQNCGFWIGVEVGILAYNLSEKLENKIRHFDYRTGMPYTFVERSTFFRDSRGYLYQGGSMTTERGFFRFHPDSMLNPDTTRPPVVLTKFSVRNKTYNLDSNITHKKKIRLNYDQNFFSFEFSSLDYRAPEKNQYAYLLEGIDDDWVYSGHRRFANYTGIPPGNYTFNVKGSNHDGFWNEQGAKIAVVIAPPPWATWWAYMIYTILLTAMVFAWRRYDLKRQNLRQQLKIEHVEAEKLKELDKMKSRFFANISHEFRTPLTLILGPMENLRKKTSDLDSKKAMDVILRNAKRLLRLINQLLDLSKLEDEHMKLHATKVNLVAQVKGYVQSFESLARKKEINLVVQTTQDHIPAWIDREKLENILNNLLSNAFKFTGRGGNIAVSIETKKRTNIKSNDGPDTDCVLIKIIDSGCGIPAEKLAHIFDRFYQVDDTYTSDQEGSGIGLALAKELVELHGGKIAVESVPEVGTTFLVKFRLGKSHLKENQIAHEETPKRSTSKSVGFPEIKSIPINNTIFFQEAANQEENFNLDDIDGDESKPALLIVEDNADLRAYIRSYLDEGYRVIEAFDGLHGLRKANEFIPDLIISDLMMPKMDGIELCSNLKTLEQTSHIPVILLTAKAAIEDKIQGLETGADDFITKPFDPQELLIRVRNLIAQRKKLREYYRKEIDPMAEVAEVKINSMDQQFLHKIKKIIDENMSDPDFSVEKLAADMAMSRVQMHRKLKALLNLSITDLIRYLRLVRAKILLGSKHKTITEIAFEVGFNNLSYFSKCFQKQFGVKPSEYFK